MSKMNRIREVIRRPAFLGLTAAQQLDLINIKDINSFRPQGFLRQNLFLDLNRNRAVAVLKAIDQVCAGDPALDIVILWKVIREDFVRDGFFSRVNIFNNSVNDIPVATFPLATNQVKNDILSVSIQQESIADQEGLGVVGISEINEARRLNNGGIPV